MHRELVERRKWIDEARFLHALNYCMLLPGPEAQQLATYIGWLMHRTVGGLVAGTLFVLPGFVAVLGLSIMYATSRETPWVAAVFFGLKAAVLAIVVEAVVRIGRRALKRRGHVVIAALAFVALFIFGVPFPAVVLAAAVIGLVADRLVQTATIDAPRDASTGNDRSLVDAMAARGELAHTEPSTRRSLRVVVTCVVLWGAPVVVLAVVLGTSSVFVQEAVFFSKTAMVTFGGAYAVLAYVAQRAVETYGWLRPGEMLDGLGLAETTPGPLILVVQFVGFLGAFREPGGLEPLLAGILGAGITVWVTFVPCFLWIFLGGPYLEKLRGNPALTAAMSAITAAVVGVILNLSLWFAVHVLFAEVTTHVVGPARLLLPTLASIDVSAALLTVFAMLAVFRWKLGVPATLASTAALGVVAQMLPAFG
jgi:chromate transporter